MQCIFGRRTFPELTQVWCVSGTFSDLPRSIEEACHHYGANTDSADEQQKMFWLQFQESARPQVFGDKLKQLVELQQTSRPTMEDLCRAIWPRDPLPTSYLGLVRLLQEASAQVKLWKKLACTEGARQDFVAV